MSETYAGATNRLLSELAERGWQVDRRLKTPAARRPSGGRIWFTPQAIYCSPSDAFADSHSLFIDRRGLSADRLIARVAMRLDLPGLRL